MKSKLHFRLLTAAALSAVWASGLAAADAQGAEAAVPPKKADVRVDPTPVTEGRAGMIVSYADVVEPVQKAVVSIYSTKIVKERVRIDPFFRQFFNIPDQEVKQEGLGSGVIVSPDGYILTNNHVVEGADELKVTLSDDRDFIAKVIGTDPKTDIAVVKIEAANLPTVTLADSSKVRVGDIVFAVGNPLNVGQTVTSGIVSAKGRRVGLLDGDGANTKGYEDFIQTDAAINMGNSGGALIDAKGRFVGINSAIVSPSRGNIGIGFAVPVNMAANVMRSLIETGTVSRGFLGVGGDPITPDIAEQVHLPKDATGVIVTDTVPDGPADKAGLKRGDVILQVNGKAITNHDELRLTISQMAPGSKVALSVSRDGKPMTIDVTLTQFSERPNELLDGVEVGKLTDDVRRHLGIDSRITGLVVTKVDDKSDYTADLPQGAVVVEINRQPAEDLAAAKALLHPGRNLLLVYYQGYQRYVVVTKR